MRLSGLAFVSLPVALAALLVPGAAAVAAGSQPATGVSINAYQALETARGTARTVSLPGGGDLIVNAFGAVTRQANDGSVQWMRSTGSLYQDWHLAWQTPSYVPLPQLAWGTQPADPLEFFGDGDDLVADTTPYAIGSLAGNLDIAVAETVGVNITGSNCPYCREPFNVPGSGLHLGTFVTVLNAQTGRTLYHQLDPGYVTQLAITDDRLIIGDETGDPQSSGGIGAWGSVSTVRALSFRPAGSGLAATTSWEYSTGAPWARLLAMTTTGAGGVAVSWSDTPIGLGVPGPPDGHVLLLDAGSGAPHWAVRTPGYPVLLGADPRSGQLVAVETADPSVSVGYAVAGLDMRNGLQQVSVTSNGALPLSLAVGPAGWVVGAVDATVPNPGNPAYDATDGVVSLIAGGRQAWSTVFPAGPDGVPQPGGVLFSGGSVRVASWLEAGGPTAASPSGVVDSVAALSAAHGTLLWQQAGDVGDPLSMSAAGSSVRMVTTTQLVDAFSPGGQVTTEAAAPADLLCAVTATIGGDTSLVAGDQNGEVYAFDGPGLAAGTTRILWQARLPGAVHQIVTATLDGRQVVVAAATTAVAVLDASTGHLLTLIQLPGSFAWTVTVAESSSGPVAVVAGSSLTAYSLSTGSEVWQYQAPAGAWFSDAAYGDGIVAAEYSSPGTSSGPAAEMAAVGIDAVTGAAAWTQPSDPADTIRGQLWNGVIASPAIPGAGGQGVAFAWATTEGGRVDVRDISTGALEYSDTGDDLGAHTAFVADPGAGLISVGGLGTALITPQGPQGSSTPGTSAAVASTGSGLSALLVANLTVTALALDSLGTSPGGPEASSEVFDAGTLVSADLDGSGSEQVVSLPPDSTAYEVVSGESGYNIRPDVNTLQYGMGVLTLAPASSAAATARASGAAAALRQAGALPAFSAAGSGSTGSGTVALPEPERPGTEQPLYRVVRPAGTQPADGPQASGQAAPAGYSPALIRSYLDLTGDGAGQTVAIIDAYADPDITADAETFSTQFGLPGVCGAGGTPGDCFTLQVSQPDGTAGTNAQWALETSLDVEWAHSLAPLARILLVDGHDDASASLFRAVDAAAAADPAAISMSWGMPEFSDETYYDPHCAEPDVVCVAATGDKGHPGSYPAYSPHVLAVGGTTLALAADGSVTSEVSWADSGGGRSYFEHRPPSQRGVAAGGRRETPDVSFDADPQTGVAVYDSVPLYGESGWWQVGGTSLGAPAWSALLADADQLRQAAGRSPLTDAAAHSAIYALPGSALADVTAGPANGFCPVGCVPGPGYDEVTGLGSPRAGLDVALATAGP